jgi:lipopolysaccharide/colanic/teichoic acid biosynthesis glycosyltransferase
VACYTPEQRKVLTVRLGIAGPAAIKFRHEETLLADVTPEELDRVYLPEKLALDLTYLENRSLLLDIQTLVQAVLISLKS